MGLDRPRGAPPPARPRPGGTAGEGGWGGEAELEEEGPHPRKGPQEEKLGDLEKETDKIWGGGLKEYEESRLKGPPKKVW